MSTPVQRDDRSVDQAVVDEVCRRVAERPGDPAVLVIEEIRRLAPLHTVDEQGRLVDDALARLTGLGELDAFVRDPDVDEVMINAGRLIWLDRRGSLDQVGELESGRIGQLIERVLAPLGRRIDRRSPIVDARLADGSRVCAVLPPVAVDGPALSIRRFTQETLPLSSFTDETGCTLLRDVIDARCNVVVSGATSSGKTSLVAALLQRVPHGERLLVVEDTTELAIDHPNVVRLEARPPTVDGPEAIEVADLVRTALRLRPDRIVVGEVRGDEALGLVQAMNTGHDGSVSTCHANGPLDALLRLESLVLQAAPTWPLAAIRHQLARSIDVVVHVERRPGGTNRTIASVSEVVTPQAISPPGHEIDAPKLLGRRNADDSFQIVGRLERRRR